MYIDRTGRPTGFAIHQLADSLANRLRNRRRRKQFNTLLGLDDHMLDDIGVTRAEVEAASSLPLSVNAAIELRRLSLSRRKARH